MLKVIGGTARGIRLKYPDMKNTRPTQAAIKESVFNILMPYLSDSMVLDLFAGSGSLGIEALSRGAVGAVFVDQSRACRDIIRDNLNKTKLSNQAFVLNMDAASAIKHLNKKGKKFDIIFLDPPYNMNFLINTIQSIDEFDIITEEGIIACEHHIEENAPDVVGGLVKVRTKPYKEKIYSFYIREKNQPS
ncbi:MAG: 16S rRNA (guanine(966)-N(2))-methyltransferase RsmD [Acetivibrionales bacterium]|jgi:16S rRNA (guanine966-N2)-methyltransferase|nr:16S rRNA (guanine(966)-N(2))-methyltransferase RsmD [Clostridiaceae bacterium]